MKIDGFKNKSQDISEEEITPRYLNPKEIQGLQHSPERKKGGSADYISKEDNFTGEDWKPATIEICYVTIIPGHSTAEESRQIGWNVNKS